MALFELNGAILFKFAFDYLDQSVFTSRFGLDVVENKKIRKR